MKPRIIAENGLHCRTHCTAELNCRNDAGRPYSPTFKPMREVLALDFAGKIDSL
jgi:hypothetical protein